jgi:hypothetical protein
MRILTAVVGMITSLSLCTSAFAATVTTTQGQVLVNRGQGYQRVTGSTHANAGATVVANPGGSAQVVYADGCAVTVEPGSVYTIAPESPCKNGHAGLLHHDYVIGAVVVGGVALGVLLSHKGKSASP